jgi:hypothetical protein
MMLLSRLSGQTAVSGNQLHISAELHTTTTYQVVPADCGNLLSFSAASAISIAIPQTTVALLPPGCWIDFQNTGSAVATISPSEAFIDGLSSVQLNAGQGLHLVFTGSAFFSVRGGGGVWTNNAVEASSAPSFSASGMSSRTFLLTLTADVSSSTFSGASPGLYIFAITEDAAGGHNFTWPLNVTSAPAIDSGANNTTYLLCQFDGTSCAGIGNFATGPNVTPSLIIPGSTSGSNTIAPGAVAGSGSTTYLALNGTTVIPNACTGQVVQSIGGDGSITCGAGGAGSPGAAGATGPQGPAGPTGATGPPGGGGQPLTTAVSIDLGPLAATDGYTVGVVPLWSLAQDTFGNVNVPLAQIGGYNTGVWQYSATNTSGIARIFFIPADADLSSDVTATLVAAPDAAGAGGNFAWAVKLTCTSSTLLSWTWNTQASTGAYAASSTQYAAQQITTAALPVTGCTPGALARIAIARDHTVASDASVTADLYAVKLNYTRK